MQDSKFNTGECYQNPLKEVKQKEETSDTMFYKKHLKGGHFLTKTEH